jgi:2-methylisocitrate lyase-like PEP mutase family enzyme
MIEGARMSSTSSERQAAFRRLHDGPALVLLPNAWDVITARLFEEAGFPAVATSSAAVANALGFADGRDLDVELHLATIARIAGALRVPLTADVENGYADEPEALAAFIRRLAATGVAGYNLEDTKAAGELYPLDVQIARIRAARAAAPDLFMNARTDVYLEGIGPAEDRLSATTERIHAFAAAGADGVFVPGVADAGTIAALTAQTTLPLNVLAGPATPAVPALEALGVRRVSVGSWPMRRTLGVLGEIATELRERGTFGFTREAVMGYDEANALVRGPA